MKREFLSPECTNEHLQRGRHITAFTAIRQDYGLQIKVAGCMDLLPAQNGSKNVVGIIELDDQVVPILDARKQTGADITDLCCIVLFENIVGQTIIVTGQLYESACQVFDLIVECMDEPESHDRLYTLSEHQQPPLISNAVQQT